MSLEDFFPAELTLDTYVYDAETGHRMGTTSVAISSRALAGLSPPGKMDCVTTDGSRRLKEQHGRNSSVLLVCDTRNESVLAELGPFQVGGELGLVGLEVTPDGKKVLIATPRPDNTAHIYRRRRPEWWWGVFCLWEFWLTAAFAALLLWSIIRDRRALAAPK